MIPPPAAPLLALAFAQDATQPHPEPLVQAGKRRPVAVLEVLQPAHQRLIDIRDDRLEALAVRAPGLGSDRVFQLLEALPTRPAIAALEVVAQEVGSTGLGGINDPSLFRVERQAGF